MKDKNNNNSDETESSEIDYGYGDPGGGASMEMHPSSRFGSVGFGSGELQEDQPPPERYGKRRTSAMKRKTVLLFWICMMKGWIFSRLLLISLSDLTMSFFWFLSPTMKQFTKETFHCTSFQLIRITDESKYIRRRIQQYGIYR